jgi:large repetitive protein
MDSAVGPATQWRATGKPASWGAWALAPTGNNNQARASFDVPPSRGAESSVRVYVDGVKVQQLAATGKSEATFDVPNNLGPHAVVLEVCNEGAACTQSSSQPVQTYGPLVAAHIHSITPTIDAQRITWTIEVDSNGDAATLSITSDKGRSESFTVPVGVSTVTTQPKDFGFQETETVTVTLSDGSPARGPVSATNSATTEPPPPPSVVASRGAACNDDPAAGLQPCDTGIFGGPMCTDASCAFVHITLSSWRTDIPGTAVYCSVNGAGGRPYTPNDSVDTPDYYGNPGGTVTVRCENALGQVAETQFIW